MALATHDIPAFDPFLYTGPTRQIRGMARMGTVTLDTPYGTSGNSEFATRLNVATSGFVSVVKWDGTTQIIYLTAGFVHEVCTLQVNSAGTTATGIVWGS